MIDMNVITPWIWYGRRFVLDKGYQLQITETMGTIKSGRCNLSYTNSHMMRFLFIQIIAKVCASDGINLGKIGTSHLTKYGYNKVNMENMEATFKALLQWDV